MCIIEVVLSDVGQSDVVAGVEIEHVVAHSASDLEASVKAVEVTVVVGAECRPGAIILDLAIGGYGQVAACIGLNARLVAHEVLVLDDQGHFQIVEVVGELAAA